MLGQRVLGVLAGHDFPRESLAPWLDSADIVVAADGAANVLFEMGREPDFVVGDLDSLNDEARAQAKQLIGDPDQETTDVDKLLKFLVERGAESVTLANLEGDRFDHMLAAVHSALQSPLSVRLLLRQGLACVVGAGVESVIETDPGQTVSFIPMTECRGVVMSGVRWPPASVLSPTGSTSISNEATGDRITVRLEEGAGLLFANRDSRIPAW